MKYHALCRFDIATALLCAFGNLPSLGRLHLNYSFFSIFQFHFELFCFSIYCVFKASKSFQNFLTWVGHWHMDRHFDVLLSVNWNLGKCFEISIPRLKDLEQLLTCFTTSYGCGTFTFVAEHQEDKKEIKSASNEIESCFLRSSVGGRKKLFNNKTLP